MRELKFRAWDDFKMIEQEKLSWYRDRFMSGTWNYEETHIVSEEVSPVIMQYTSLKDKKGTEIYDGDILKHMQGVDKVWWDEDRWRLGNWCPSGLSEMCGLEVIGNIYENSELLDD